MSNVEKAKKSKSFCIYPWIHQYVDPAGPVKPCCLSRTMSEIGNLKQNTLAEIWNNDATKKLRLDMLNDVEVSECERCNIRGGDVTPYRDIINSEMFVGENLDLVESTNEDGSLDTHQLQFIDARFNNLCNLKCRTCGIVYSTSWFEDATKIDKLHGRVGSLQFPGQTKSQLLDEILPHLPHVKRIYFAGGEPLMQEDHYRVLEELIKLGHTGSEEKPLWVYYSTNFTHLKLGSRYILDYWTKFNNLHVNASIDGSYKRAEYWRKNTNWETIVENRKAMQKVMPNVRFTIAYALSWVNAFNLFDLHKEWVDMGLIRVNDIMVNMVDEPNHYSLRNIPIWKKKAIEARLLEHIEWLKTKNADSFVTNMFTSTISYMYGVNTSDEFLYKDEFLAETQALDEIRGENFWEVFPEHQDMKEYLNV